MAIDARNTFVYSPLDLTTSTGSSTGAAVPLASVAAGGTGLRNICKRVQISMSTSSASVQVPVTIQLFDGALSTGTVLASWQLSPRGDTTTATVGNDGNILAYVDGALLADLWARYPDRGPAFLAPGATADVALPPSLKTDAYEPWLRTGTPLRGRSWQTRRPSD